MSTTSEEPGARLQEALTSWAMHLAPAEIQESRYQVAFRAIDRALAATIRYMELRRAGKPQDQNSERQLTELWMEASHALSPIAVSYTHLDVYKRQIEKIINAQHPGSAPSPG